MQQALFKTGMTCGIEERRPGWVAKSKFKEKTKTGKALNEDRDGL